MKITDIPVKIPTPFADGAGGGFVTYPIPVPSQSGGVASFTDGFPPTTFEQLAAGGNPPFGADFNGLLKQITIWLRWAQAGGIPNKYDATFSASIGGYPQGAFVQSATAGHYWISQVDDNPTNPDAAGANWTIFPDTLIQQQSGNYTATDTGAVNHVAIALSPVPVSLASLIGSPIRFLIAHANTITTPDININGLGAVPMINSDGTSIPIGQFSRIGQFCEGYLDPDLQHFQVVSPPKPITSPSGSVLPPGAIVLCPVEVPFTGTLECDGSLKTITSYPRLFNVIGTKYGGNGVTTFALPDLRGTFPRGWDHGRGLDPDASTRTNRGDGTTGDHVGTNEGWAIGTLSASINNPVLNWLLFNSGSPGQPPSAGSTYWKGGSVPIGVDPAIGVLDFISVNQIPHSANYPSDPPPQPAEGYPIFGNATGQVLLASSISGTFTGNSTETRPVNINMMYVIAY